MRNHDPTDHDLGDMFAQEIASGMIMSQHGWARTQDAKTKATTSARSCFASASMRAASLEESEAAFRARSSSHALQVGNGLPRSF